jgi:hypothetical protein
MTPMDYLPLWGVFLIAIVLSLACVEIGFRLQRYSKNALDSDTVTGSMTGSTLGLLAFMLAFTFSVASSRYDARRLLVVKEANVIGTAYLRIDLLEQPLRQRFKDIFREYVDVRINGATNMETLIPSLKKADELQNKLWAQTAAIGQAHPNYPIYGLFISSVNEVIDVAGERLAAFECSRVPSSVWIALFSVSALGMLGSGYYSGLSGKRNFSETLIMIVAFSTVVLVVVDLDRPFEGSIRTPQQPMLELRKAINAS